MRSTSEGGVDVGEGLNSAFVEITLPSGRENLDSVLPTALSCYSLIQAGRKGNGCCPGSPQILNFRLNLPAPFQFGKATWLVSFGDLGLRIHGDANLLLILRHHRQLIRGAIPCRKTNHPYYNLHFSPLQLLNQPCSEIDWQLQDFRNCCIS